MYADMIYSTPDSWGSQTVYAAEAAMESVIANLINVGDDDWANIDLSDCDEWSLVQEVNGLGLYKQMRVRGDNYIALSTSSDSEGEYNEVRFSNMFGSHLATYNTLEDALEELAKSR